MNTRCSIRHHPQVYFRILSIAVVAAQVILGEQLIAQNDNASSSINGDRYCDIIGIRRSDSRFMIWRGGINGFSNGVFYRQEDSVDRRNVLFAVGDFDGSGCDDVIGIKPTDSLCYAVWTSNGAALNDRDVWRQESAHYDDWEFKGADVTGDRRIDVIAINRKRGDVIVWDNQNGSFGAGRVWLQDTGHYDTWLFLVGDVTGDGKADLVGIRQNQSPLIKVWGSTVDSSGSHFAKGVTFANGASSYAGSDFSLSDMTGDGIADVVAIDRSNGRVVVVKSPILNFNNAVQFRPSGGNWSTYSFMVGNVDADSLADIVAVRPNKFRIEIWRNTGVGFQQFSAFEEDSDRSAYSFYMSRCLDIAGTLGNQRSEAASTSIVVRSSSGAVVSRLECRLPEMPGTLTVVDLLGRNLHRIALEPGSMARGDVMLPDLPAGIYLLGMEVNGGKYSKICYVY